MDYDSVMKKKMFIMSRKDTEDVKWKLQMKEAILKGLHTDFSYMTDGKGNNIKYIHVSEGQMTLYFGLGNDLTAVGSRPGKSSLESLSLSLCPSHASALSLKINT